MHPDRTATLTCDDGNGNVVFTRESTAPISRWMKSLCT